MKISLSFLVMIHLMLASCGVKADSEAALPLKDEEFKGVRGANFAEEDHRVSRKLCMSKRHCYPGYCKNFHCYDGSKGDLCFAHWDCKGDLKCRFGECAKGGRKEPCGKSAECKHGYYCRFNKCWNGQEGDPCSSDGDCVTGDKTGMCIKHHCSFDKTPEKPKPPMKPKPKPPLKPKAECLKSYDCGHGYCKRKKCYTGELGDPCNYHAYGECKGHLYCAWNYSKHDSECMNDHEYYKNYHHYWW